MTKLKEEIMKKMLGEINRETNLRKRRKLVDSYHVFCAAAAIRVI